MDSTETGDYSSLRTHRRRREQGLCRCGNERDDAGRKTCSACRKRDLDAKSARRQRWLAEEKCTVCGAERDGDTLTCRDCTERGNKASTIWHMKRYWERRARGLCVFCGAEALPDITICEHCISRRAWHQRSRYERLRDSGRCVTCGRPRTGDVALRCDECMERFSRYATSHRARLRLDVFEHYGGAVCACCGETEFLMLTIDHINEDGAAHKRAIVASGRWKGIRTINAPIIQWIRENRYPDGFQCLCMNCNTAKHRNGGICPHEERRWAEGLVQPTLALMEENQVDD